MDSASMINALGGLALFLLAMRLMTEGLTLFAGNGLKKILAQWTATPWRGVGVGILVTGLVQSSSAVTIATIGFVNAGMLNLRQAIGVIFGANIGTTITAWLVSLIGFGFKIDSLSLPIITIGVSLRLVSPSLRWKGLGDALAGFGLFFLGLAILKDAFTGLASSYGTELNTSGLSSSIPGMILTGFVATLLTQSSSASIAIILTAATGGVVGFESAAAAVIGANLGTTSTAALATIKATPAAKRLALGHISFNLITGAIALALLPLLLGLVYLLGDFMDTEGSPSALLALFHSLFNILGVIIMLPLAGHLTRHLERLFRSTEEDLARPLYLDANLKHTPSLAVAALHQELVRLSALETHLLHKVLSHGTEPSQQQEIEGLRNLGSAISSFITSVQPGAMEQETADALSRALYATRYYQQSTQLIFGVAALSSIYKKSSPVEQTLIAPMLKLAESVITNNPSSDSLLTSEMRNQLRLVHRSTRHQLLEKAIAGNLAVDNLEPCLDALDSSRRALELYLKAGRLMLSHDEDISESTLLNQ